MKGTRIAAISIAALAFAAAPAWAADAAAGKAKASSCGGCHGAKGEGKGPAGPVIAGMDPVKFVAAMQEYKGGKRSNAPMKSISSGLSEADFENLAAHYAALKK